jgi:DNA-binding NarL/FixJ family response regulator
MTRVLLADDQALVRGGFRMILEAQPDIEVIGEAEDGHQAVRLAQELHPDVVLMDVRMPVMDGIEATRHLATGAETTDVRVLVLTTFDLDEYVYEALRAGASGFLLKNSPAHELAEAVRTVARGEALLAPSVTRRLIEQFVSRPPTSAELDPRLASLTGREEEVLVMISRGRSNAEIAADLFLAEATVRTHVNRIFAKLGVRDRTQAAVLAYESGLVRPGHAS